MQLHICQWSKVTRQNPVNRGSLRNRESRGDLSLGTTPGKFVVSLHRKGSDPRGLSSATLRVTCGSLAGHLRVTSRIRLFFLYLHLLSSVFRTSAFHGVMVTLTLLWYNSAQPHQNVELQWISVLATHMNAFCMVMCLFAAWLSYNEFVADIQTVSFSDSFRLTFMPPCRLSLQPFSDCPIPCVMATNIMIWQNSTQTRATAFSQEVVAIWCQNARMFHQVYCTFCQICLECQICTTCCSFIGALWTWEPMLRGFVWTENCIASACFSFF